jgi:hypothetical protein
MGALADELEIRRAGRGTRLRLRFARPATADAGRRP